MQIIGLLDPPGITHFSDFCWFACIHVCNLYISIYKCPLYQYSTVNVKCCRNNAIKPRYENHQNQEKRWYFIFSSWAHDNAIFFIALINSIWYKDWLEMKKKLALFWAVAFFWPRNLKKLWFGLILAKYVIFHGSLLICDATLGNHIIHWDTCKTWAIHCTDNLLSMATFIFWYFILL